MRIFLIQPSVPGNCIHTTLSQVQREHKANPPYCEIFYL